MGEIEKVQNFSSSNRKKVKEIDKVGNENVETISYKIKFIDSTRFMATSLSNLVDNLTERLNKIKCKHCIVFLNMKVLRIIW